MSIEQFLGALPPPRPSSAEESDADVFEMPVQPEPVPCAAHPSIGFVHLNGPCQCFLGGPAPEFIPSVNPAQGPKGELYDFAQHRIRKYGRTAAYGGVNRIDD